MYFLHSQPLFVFDENRHQIEKSDEASLESSDSGEPRDSSSRFVATIPSLASEDVHVAPVIPLQQLRQVGFGAVEGMRTQQTAQVGVGGVQAVVLSSGQSAQLVVRHSKLWEELNRLRREQKRDENLICILQY